MQVQQAARKSDWMPEILGNYQILSRLGQGGMGDIYKAIQKPLNRTVALKVLSPYLSRNEEFPARFEIEAKAISLLQHQNIVGIFEYGEEYGLKYFAMQYIEGFDLGRRITAKKPMSFEEIIDYSKQICRGLRYAHGQNVIHRDIKPQNVLIDKDNVCRLSDFGIAKIFQATNITMTGMAVGTPEYMSPEQAEGGDLDEQTDMYSLGVVIYEMLTKRPPFTGNNPVSIAYKQVHEYPVPPSARRRDTPKRLELIVCKCLKKNRKERYRNVEDLLNDLDTVDLAEKAQRPTIALAADRIRSITAPHVAEEKRITDRRGGDRRHRRGAGAGARLLQTLRAQALSLTLWAALAVLFGLHLVNHP
jgi:serine/threonine-protein kinase